MRKFLLKALYGDPIKVARIVLPIGALLGVSLALGDRTKYDWSPDQIILISLIILVFIAFGYTQVKPPRSGEKY